MEKLGVDESLQIPESEEKLASGNNKCPWCGSAIEVHGRVRKCPKCGTAPWEGENDGGKESR